MIAPKYSIGEIVMAHCGEGIFKPVVIKSARRMQTLHPMFHYSVTYYPERTSMYEPTLLGCPEAGLRKLNKAEELLYL